MSPLPVDPDEDRPRATQAAATDNLLVPGEDLQPGDVYREGEYLVFTAQYHLRRGYCCNSDCRHCPYREPPAPTLVPSV